MRIAFFHNECAPYRMPIFKRLHQREEFNIKIYFGRYRSKDRHWDVNELAEFNNEILDEISGMPELFTVFETEPNPFNPSLFFKLIQGKYDVFISGVPSYFGSFITYAVSKILHKPFILFLEDYDRIPIETSSKINSIRNLSIKDKIKLPFYLLRLGLASKIIRDSDAYVVPGIATKEFLLKRGIKPSKIFTAVNSVDNKQLTSMYMEIKEENKPIKLLNKLDASNRKIILYLGQFVKSKGVDYLLEAYRLIKEKRNDVILILAGYGPELNQYKTIISEKNIEDVIFTGYVDGKEKIIYYSIADVFVLPTLNDVWGFVINEAMLCGSPIISTHNAGASKDLIKNGINGFIIKPANINELYESLNIILNNDPLKKSMSLSSKKIIENYNYENSASGFIRAIQYAFRMNISGNGEYIE